MVCGINNNAKRCGGGTSRAPYPTDLLPWGSCFSRFIFNFQASNKVQEVLFCAIRTSHRVHLTHVDKMFPHTLLPCRIFDLG